MTRKLMLVALMAVSLVAASADVFTFNVDYCTDPCLGGVPANNNGGTVTLTQFAANIVTVTVQLNNLVFHDQGLESFAFNVTGNPPLTLNTDGTIGNNEVLITNAGGSTWTFHRPAGNTDGAGTFMYSFECAAAPAQCAGGPSVFAFQVDVTGLTVAGLEILGGANVDFAANVSAGAGACTGMIGAGNGTGQSTPATAHTDGTACAAAVPEPTTLALVGSGLITLGMTARRKWKARHAV
jgi:hypothetical protein